MIVNQLIDKSFNYCVFLGMLALFTIALCDGVF